MSDCKHAKAYDEDGNTFAICGWCEVDRMTTENAELRESAKRADLWKDRESATQAKYEAVCYERDTLKTAMEEIDRKLIALPWDVSLISDIHSIVRKSAALGKEGS